MIDRCLPAPNPELSSSGPSPPLPSAAVKKCHARGCLKWEGSISPGSAGCKVQDEAAGSLLLPPGWPPVNASRMAGEKPESPLMEALTVGPGSTLGAASKPTYFPKRRLRAPPRWGWDLDLGTWGDLAGLSTTVSTTVRNASTAVGPSSSSPSLPSFYSHHLCHRPLLHLGLFCSCFLEDWGGRWQVLFWAFLLF